MDWFAVAVMPPDAPTVPVATSPNDEGVPFPVHIARRPMVGMDEVEIEAIRVKLLPPTSEPTVPP